MPADAIDVTKSDLIPSLGLHGGLSLVAWTIARATDRVDIKDCGWPISLVLNAWWSAVGRHTFRSPHRTTDDVLYHMTWHQKVLLGAVTVWGARLA